VVTSAVAVVMTAVLMAYYSWENKRRDGLAQGHKENIEFLDLTDRENKEFRVSYLTNYSIRAQQATDFPIFSTDYREKKALQEDQLTSRCQDDDLPFTFVHAHSRAVANAEYRKIVAF
jgi:hypothetical protein